MRSFIGSNGIFYRNEICLDTSNGKTIASADLEQLKINAKENELRDLRNRILEVAKTTSNYNENLTYGVYQIKEELNTSYKNEQGRIIYDYPDLNSFLSTLTSLLKNYYLEEIVPFLFKYELLK